MLRLTAPAASADAAPERTEFAVYVGGGLLVLIIIIIILVLLLR
jgi:hypothetical protein